MATEQPNRRTEMSLGSRSLCRVVSAAEYEQVLSAGQFEIAGGAEGKYFWEDLNDAIFWSGTFANSWIIEAKYPAAVVELFYLWIELDGLGAARFADEAQMNQSLLEIRSISQSEQKPK